MYRYTFSCHDADRGLSPSPDITLLLGGGLLSNELVRLIGKDVLVSTQNPVQLDDCNEPEEGAYRLRRTIDVEGAVSPAAFPKASIALAELFGRE